MVARDGGDVAMLEAAPERVAVGTSGRAQRWADLGEGPPAFHLLVGEQQVLRARLGPHGLAFGVSALDALEAELGGEMDDVDGTAGEAADQDGAVDRLFLGPVRARRWEVGRRRAARGDRLVLEVTQH